MQSMQNRGDQPFGLPTPTPPFCGWNGYVGFIRTSSKFPEPLLPLATLNPPKFHVQKHLENFAKIAGSRHAGLPTSLQLWRSWRGRRRDGAAAMFC